MTLTSWLVLATAFTVLVGGAFLWLNRPPNEGTPQQSPTAEQRVAALEARCRTLTRALACVALSAVVVPFALVRFGYFFGVPVWTEKVIVGDSRTDYEHDMTVITDSGVKSVRVKPEPTKGAE